MERLKRLEIEDDFLKSCSDIEGFNCISIERTYDTLGNVMRQMAAYNKEDFDSLTIENYRMNHADHKMNLRNRYPDGVVITAGGDLCYYMSRKGKRVSKSGWNNNEYSLDTPFIDIIADYAEANNWDNEVYVISYYTGICGLLVSTVFEVKNKRPLFSFTSLEMYGNWRAR